MLIVCEKKDLGAVNLLQVEKEKPIFFYNLLDQEVWVIAYRLIGDYLGVGGGELSRRSKVRDKLFSLL